MLFSVPTFRTPIARQKGFTIVELLIVVVVIAILAAITVVAYNGISTRAKETVLKQDVQSAAKQLEVAKTSTGAYPVDTSSLKKSTDTTFTYTRTDTTFCLSATSSGLAGKTFYVSENLLIQEGTCPPLYLQNITTASCPTSRTLAVDARDTRTYWVQKLADGRCWMLTNLAYAGGGTNTYGDVKTIQNGTGNSADYSPAEYYIHANSNPTSNPTTPSIDATGGGVGAGRQYGYYYNWCGAMGGQATAACSSSDTPTPNPAISVCPAGWRLPTGMPTTGEFTLLTNALGGPTSDYGLITTMLAQRTGYRYSGTTYQSVGDEMAFWSSSQSGSYEAYALRATNSSLAPDNGMNNKWSGMTVRCIAV